MWAGILSFAVGSMMICQLSPMRGPLNTRAHPSVAFTVRSTAEESLVYSLLMKLRAYPQRTVLFHEQPVLIRTNRPVVLLIL